MSELSISRAAGFEPPQGGREGMDGVDATLHAAEFRVVGFDERLTERGELRDDLEACLSGRSQDMGFARLVGSDDEQVPRFAVLSEVERSAHFEWDGGGDAKVQLAERILGLQERAIEAVGGLVQVIWGRRLGGHGSFLHREVAALPCVPAREPSEGLLQSGRSAVAFRGVGVRRLREPGGKGRG